LHTNPVLAEAVLSDNVDLVQAILDQQEATKRQEEDKRNHYINQLNADPFDTEAQRKIEEEIRMDNVNQNYENAIEFNPEAFATVTMLYINCDVNGVPIKAFLDSGAQSTIMSAKCAERCGIMRLIDKRFSGIAKGVGTAKILGRVHIVPLKIGKEFFSSSFTILEGSDLDLLLGLDNLKKHLMMIDLKENVLRVGEEKVPFLAERDIPLSLRLSADDLRNSGDGHPNIVPVPKNTTPITTPTPIPTPKSAAKLPVAASKPTPKTQPASPYPPDTVQKLMDLGYTREQVLRALQLYGGNAEMAASYLFSSSTGFF